MVKFYQLYQKPNLTKAEALRRAQLSLLEGKRFAIPAYAALQDDGRMSARMLDLLLSGVYTRDYQKVIREMAETVDVSKSSVSRVRLFTSTAGISLLKPDRTGAICLFYVR